MLQDIHINYFLSAPDVNFFCASNQKPLGPNRNTRGSFWAMFSEVTGVERATPNTVRRGLEATVQSSPRYAARSTDIQGHSLQVGTEYYHRTADEVRFLCIYNQARKEIPTEQVQDDDSDNEVENDGDDFSTPSKRQKLMEQDEELRRNIAMETLKKSAEKRTLVHGKGVKLLPADRTAVQEMLCAEKYRNITKLDPNKKLPGRNCFMLTISLILR